MLFCDLPVICRGRYDHSADVRRWRRQVGDANRGAAVAREGYEQLQPGLWLFGQRTSSCDSVIVYLPAGPRSPVRAPGAVAQLWFGTTQHPRWSA
jgi:hypothetical protein